jgi:flagellar hook assembly protein FlgD
VFSSGLSSSSDASKPITFTLKQNFPNPFNPSTMIEYSLDEPAPVRIEIFDIRGELVRTLVNEYQQSGVHTAAWNGKTDTGGALPTGVYSYSLVTAGKQAARKMILLR